MDRDTRCIQAFGVVYERDWNSLQDLVDQAAPSRHYFSDGFATYAQLLYPGKFLAVLDKSQTYKARPTRSRQTTPSCGITWHGLAEGAGASAATCGRGAGR